jgi:ABC-type multidrug transport system ATPase subunit
MIETVIATHGLSKRYRDVLAVDRLELDVRRGEVYGFLGRNGAGKTTTIRMLLGLVRPTEGEVTVLGKRIEPRERAVLRQVGYLVETASAYPNLTVRENLEIQRRLTSAAPEGVAHAIDLMGLGPYKDKRAGRLSLGNKQRLSLARALLHSPDVLVLDEPANALDPAGIVEIRELLRTLASERGVTVFMSSHILAEVAHLADRIGIVHEGRLLEELDREELAGKARAFVEVKVAMKGGDGTAAAHGAEAVLREGGISRVESDATDTPGTLRVFEAPDRAPEIGRLLVGAGFDLEALTPTAEDLESYFLRLTGTAPSGADETRLAADARESTVGGGA